MEGGLVLMEGCHRLMEGCYTLMQGCHRLIEGGDRPMEGGHVPMQGGDRRRNVKWFRGGLIFKAHRLLYHSTLGSRVTKKKKVID